MIQIDYEQAQKIRAKYPETHIRRTANKYYAEETPRVLTLLGRNVGNTRSGNRYAGKTPRRK